MTTTECCWVEAGSDCALRVVLRGRVVGYYAVLGGL